MTTVSPLSPARRGSGALAPIVRSVKRADGRVVHQAYSRVTGKKKYVGSYDSERAAHIAIQEHEVTQRGIAAGTIAPQLDTKRTLNEAADAWLLSLKSCKSRSWDHYTDRMKLYIRPVLGRRSLASVTTADVMKLRDDMSSEAYKPGTVNGMLVCLSSAFTYFITRQWLDKNPCKGVKHVEDPVTSFNWIRTREEITRLLAVSVDDLRDMIAIAVGTGLRLDELLHLEHPDIDLPRRLITVWRGRKGTVKGGKIRYVPILDSVLPIFQRRSLNRAGASLVFPGRDGMVRAKQAVTAIYKLALKRAGLDTTLRWHDLRHTFAAHWVANGGDIFRLCKVLGHSSVKITQERYAHLMPEAYEQDYGRVSFVVPEERAVIHFISRDERGRIVGRKTSAASG